MLRLLQLPEIKASGLPRLIRRALAVLGAAGMFLMPLMAGAAPGFRATLDRDSITLGETATLTLDFEGGAANELPAMPLIPYLQIQSQGQSSQITMVNGAVSAVESHIFLLSPTQPGVYAIPELTAKIDGQAIKSPALKLTVLKPGAPAPNNAGGTPQLAFVKFILPKTEVYLGEILQTELDLYLQDGVRGLRDMQLTPVQAEGFTVGKMMEGQQRQTRVGNLGYTMVPFTMAFTAVKAGKLNLGSAGVTAALLLPPLNMFGQPTRQERVNPMSEPATIQVLPLPRENVPPGFNGAVGNFTLTATVSPTNVAVGDPLTVKIQISGRGALDSLTLPDQPEWQGFKVYPPTSDFQPVDQMGISGTKNFALTVVPESMELKALPAFRFSFFDPDQKQYRTLTQPAVPLTVRPSAASLPPPVASNATSAADNTPATGRDIIHIKPRLGALSEIQPPLALRGWFVTLQGVPIVVWFSLMVARKQRERLAGNPRLRRQLQVEQTIRKGLKELRDAANANDREKFFATMFRLLQEQLGERLDLPASAITEAVVEERLGSHGVPEETLAVLRELFQACNQARYAHQESNEDLISLVPRVQWALEELRKLRA